MLDENGREDRDVDEANLDVVDEEPQEEDDGHHEGEYPVGAEPRVEQDLLDQFVAVEAPEDEAEGIGADQDDEHETRNARGRAHDVPEHLHREASLERREDQATRRADRRAFGRRGDADEDRAEHRDDQHQRRRQRDRHALERVGLERGQLRLRDRRAQMGLPVPEDEQVDDVEADEDEARKESADIEVSHRDAHDVAQEHEDDARRDDLAEGARGADGSADQLLLVAAPDHGRERHQAHRDHAGSDDAGRRGQDRADDHDRDGDAAFQPSEEQCHRLEQFLGNPRFLERHPHEDEQGHREEREVGHRPPDPQRQQVEEREAEPDQTEEHAGEGEAERDREAEEQEDQHPNEHRGAERLVPGKAEHQWIS